MIDNIVRQQSRGLRESYKRSGRFYRDVVDDDISELIIHRNPRAVIAKEEGSCSSGGETRAFDFDSMVYSFASPYVLKSLFALDENMIKAAKRQFFSGWRRAHVGSPLTPPF